MAGSSRNGNRDLQKFACPEGPRRKFGCSESLTDDFFECFNRYLKPDGEVKKLTFGLEI